MTLRENSALWHLKEERRQLWRFVWMEQLSQDIRYGLRVLAKSPGFAVVAILTLALGIGANTAIFSVLYPLLLRDLPVRNPNELVQISSAGRLGPLESSEVRSFYLYRDKSRVFSGVLGFSAAGDCEVETNGRTSNARDAIVSGNYFTVLGVRPFAGRLFTSEDGKAASGSAVVVLSFDYWKRALDSDPDVLGKTVSLNKIAYRIVGIAPPGFFGVEVGASPDLYLSLGDDLTPQDEWRAQWMTILGRLKPGVSLAQAHTDLEPLFEESVRESTLPEIEKQNNMARLVLTPAGRGLSEVRERLSAPMEILMGVVGLILLIACANVASLMLARGLSRKKEITVRLALGAGRWRLIRQLLTESALLAALGTIAGVLVGRWASAFLVASLSSKRFPLTLDATLSGPVLLFTAAVSLMTVLLAGLAPAVSASRSEHAQDLKVQSSGGASSSRGTLGKLLVVVQVALSVTVLMGAGLLLRSLVNLETFDAGFDRGHVLLVSITGPAQGRSPTQLTALYAQILERARNLPGVRSASYSAFSPLSGTEVGINLKVEGYTLQPGETANDLFVGVSSGYFETMGIPLLAGRDFTGEEVQSKAPVLIINRTMAHRFFGDESPLGKHVQFVEGSHPPMEIVGVVGDSKYNDLRESAADFFYVPGGTGRVLDVRAIGPPGALAAPLRSLIHSLDSSVKIGSIQTLQQEIDESLHPDVAIAALTGVFGFLALALACVGLYGTLSFSVARRKREIGVRMALGARPRDVLQLVVGQGVKLTAGGLLLGAVGALASSSLIAGWLFGVKPADPLTIGAVCAIFLAGAVLACAAPARRAARVDPMDALRTE